MHDGLIRQRKLRIDRLRWTRGWLLLVLLTLLASIVFYAVLDQHTGWLSLGLVVVLMGSFRALERGVGEQVAALALAVPHVAFIALHEPGVDGPALRIAGQAFGIAFYSYVSWTILRHVIRARVVVADTLYGAASVYLLLALAWALAYAILDTLSPGAFAGPHTPLAWDDFVYFSVVTVTTLGYGDMLAVTPGARSLVMLEVVVGVFYTTVVLARLVGLYIAQTTSIQDERR